MRPLVIYGDSSPVKSERSRDVRSCYWASSSHWMSPSGGMGDSHGFERGTSCAGLTLAVSTDRRAISPGTTNRVRVCILRV